MKQHFLKLIQTCDSVFSGMQATDPEFYLRAEEVLSESKFLPSLNELSIPVYWKIKDQHYQGEFSPFSLTLHRWKNFHLDVYLWNKGSTNLHDHHFNGAFKVINGCYQQSTFRFIHSQRIDRNISRGSLKKVGQENLKIGSVQRIVAGKFIHSVNHTEVSNMTLCLRTKDLKSALNGYFFPGIKIKLERPTNEVMNKLRYLSQIFSFGELPASFFRGISTKDIFIFGLQHFNDEESLFKFYENFKNIFSPDLLKELYFSFKKTKLLT